MAQGSPAQAAPRPVPEVSPGWDAVVLLQMGGPATLDEIQPFLECLFADRDIIRLPRWMRPFQPALARYVARKRAPKVRPRYEAMGQGSPLQRITDEQAAGLQAVLGVPVHVAMRYTKPWARDAVATLKAAGARRVLLLPLFPHWSLSTTSSSFKDFARAARDGGLDARLFHVRDWGTHPRYLDLVARLCEETLADLRARTAEPVHLVFSAHGVPVRYVKEGDSYQREVEATAALLKERLSGAFASVQQGYQSAVGPVKWIGPDTQDVLQGLVDGGAKAVVVSPLGFVSDHIETMYDMDTLYRGFAEARGLLYARVPSFNARKEFSETLAQLARGPAEPFEVSRWTT
jgi:ferrochelatase